jgi:methylamine dehydrogenase accessory protein MauD
MEHRDMMQALIVSNFVLWILVLVLAGVVLALSRQIGVLLERVAPAGALVNAKGPEVGEAAPIVDVEAWSGQRHRVGGADDEASTLLLFVSPTCPVCEVLIPFLDSLAKDQRRSRPLAVLLASDGPREEHEAFIRQHGIDRDRYVLSRDLGLQYQVEKLPFAVLIDEAGVLRARGLVNSREHLESLFEARDRNVASLQEYLERANAG